MKTTIELAREAGIDAWWDSGSDWRETFNEHLKVFEALVRADERNSWPAEMEAMERQVNILTDALAAEREACAKVADEHMQECEGKSFGVGKAIRNRGNT
jgi:hypothetical protein